MKRACLWLLLTACGDTGGQRLTVSLSSAGADDASFALGDATVTLARAELAFGPAYFCASQRAEPEVCPDALLELRDTLVLDGLAARSDDLTTLEGTSGTVQSAMFDYGISWLLTDASPRSVGGALAGHSARIAGEITRGDAHLRFAVDLDLTPKAIGALVMNGQRSAHVLGPDDVLVVSVDPRRWLARVDVDALFALDADGDGAVLVDESSQAYVAIRQGLETGAPPSFRWE